MALKIGNIRWYVEQSSEVKKDQLLSFCLALLSSCGLNDAEKAEKAPFGFIYSDSGT